MNSFIFGISSGEGTAIPLIFTINRIVRTVESEVGLDRINPRTRMLLRLIGEAKAFGSAPRTADLVADKSLGTPPTIYAGLSELEEGGWIERRPDEDDARARRLHLTARARKVFARISKLVEQEL